MQNLVNLQNSLLELQSMITGTITPVFNDLQNSSNIFDPVISSHTLMIQKIDEMITFLNSGVIVGLQGEQGIQGLRGDNGLSFVLSQFILDKIVDSSTSVTYMYAVPVPELVTPDLDENAIYEVECYILFSSVAVTTGMGLSLSVPSNAIFYGEISTPLSNNTGPTPHHFFSPSANSPFLVTTSVGVANQQHTAVIKGIIRTGLLGSVNNCQVEFASEVSGSAVTIKAGSFMILKRIL